MIEGLDALLAEADPADLLPARRSEEASQVELPFSIVGSSSLGDGLEYLVVEDARGIPYGVPAVVESGRLIRAMIGRGASEALVSALAAGRHRSDSLEFTVFHGEPVSGERAIDVDQTNELVVVGEAAVVKWFLHPVGREQPAVRRLAALEKAGFTGTPRTWGLVHLVHGHERLLVATVSAFLPAAQDGWEWAVNDLRDLALGRVGDVLPPVREVGRLVGELHACLADAGVAEASAADAALWLARARDDAKAAQLEPAVREEVDAHLAALGSCAGTPTMLVHGDLHIGQILRAGEPSRYYVIDFDGNPTQSAAEGLQRQPAARDVAGMLASLDHVGRVVLHRTDGLDEAARMRVLAWIEEAQGTFLDAYTEAIRAAGHPDLLDLSLLEAMQIQQECREYAYAARYLPHWRYVPDAALPALLSRSRGSEAP